MSNIHYLSTHIRGHYYNKYINTFPFKKKEKDKSNPTEPHTLSTHDRSPDPPAFMRATLFSALLPTSSDAGDIISPDLPAYAKKPRPAHKSRWRTRQFRGGVDFVWDVNPSSQMQVARPLPASKKLKI